VGNLQSEGKSRRQAPESPRRTRNQAILL